MTQQFFAGDLVNVAEDLGMSMRHFDSGCQAIVQYSYADQYGSSSNKQYNKEYSLYIIKTKTSSAWYHEHQLTLVEPNRFDLLPANYTMRRNHEVKMERDRQFAMMKG